MQNIASIKKTTKKANNFNYFINHSYIYNSLIVYNSFILYALPTAIHTVKNGSQSNLFYHHHEESNHSEADSLMQNGTYQLISAAGSLVKLVVRLGPVDVSSLVMKRQQALGWG